MRTSKWLAALLLAVSFCSASARAMESVPAVSKRTIASLVSDADNVSPDGTIRLGLRLIQAPGWHTYWRNPGDAGVPAELAFELPPGVTASPVAWPTPQRVSEGPITTFAYTGELLLPVTVHSPSGALPVTLRASWLVCAAICVPEEAVFTLSIPAGTGAPSPQAGLFAHAAERTPRPSPWPARIDPAGVLRLTGPDLGPTAVSDAWFAPYQPGRIDLAAPQQLELGEGVLSLGLKPIGPVAPLPVAPMSGVLVLRDPAGRQSAFDVLAEPGPAVAAPPPPPAAMPGLRVLAAALLGGLLLNVMPCVFPVLAMKAAGLAGLGDAGRTRARRLAASYLFGTVATFCALGLLLVALRRAGELAGWGFQFQSPAFVAAAAFLLFLVGLNLSGVFAIGGSRLAGAGQGLAGRGGHLGSFATGALAVLVATPCTAPFMGVAIAAALASPGALAVGVFGCLGVGLALPYVALAWLPGVARVLPRPGAWMERLRQALAFPLYLTVAWLAWVLAQQAGADGVLLVAVGCTVLGFAGWLLGLAQSRSRARPALLGLALAAAVAVFGSVATIRPAASAPGTDAFSVGRLAELRGAGRPVFIDMTAAWCVTCLVNERLALAPDAVRAAFARRGVVLLRGDWTSRDGAITEFLRAHGSDGVPLYIFYPGDGRAPLVLPQLLTPGIVLAALSA